MRFLIVDDSSLSRTQIKAFFDKVANIEFEEAVNGIDALEKHRVFKPDFIFLDYIIPAPDGLAVLKIISQIDSKAKIIMMTTLGNQKFVQEQCNKYGALGILNKPLSQEATFKAISQVFKIKT